MELPTLEKVSENYHKWENYKNNLETLLKKTLPLANKRFIQVYCKDYLWNISTTSIQKKNLTHLL